MTDSILPFKVRCIDTPNGRLWCAMDVFTWLGYKDGRNLGNILGRYTREQVTKAVFGTSGGKQSMIALTDKGILRFASSSRKPKAKLLCEYLGVKVIPSCVETDIVYMLSECFSHLHPVPQFIACGYRVDLYFTKAKIAVEIDEIGHSNRNKDYERSREATIKDALGCTFVRCNPHAKDFSMGKLINQIILITQSTAGSS